MGLQLFRTTKLYQTLHEMNILFSTIRTVTCKAGTYYPCHGQWTIVCV